MPFNAFKYLARDPFPGLGWGAPAYHSDAPELGIRATSAPLGEAGAAHKNAGIERALSDFSFSSHTMLATCHRVTVLEFSVRAQVYGPLAR